MKIVSLESNGYIRMMLNNINKFVITPEALIQLILGTNGSGKSSLMKELSPLPADKDEYTKSGSKIIRLTERGKNYTLTSKFDPKPSHSFYSEDDGEELNPGGTATAQKELVKQYFKITPEIHGLLIGDECFHSMSTARRREWFTMLSDVSYDYALSAFIKLKKRHRDIAGALELAKKRLVAERAKLMSDAEENKLKQDVEFTHKELNLLIEHAAPIERPIDEFYADLERGHEDLQMLSNRLLMLRISEPSGIHHYGDNPNHQERDDWGALRHTGFRSIEEIDDVIDRIKHDITRTETIINTQVREHAKLTDAIKVLTKAGEDGIKSLQARFNEQVNRRNELLENRALKIGSLSPENAKSALEAVYEQLVAIFTVIPENPDKVMGRVRHASLTEIIQTIKEQQIFVTGKLNQLNSKKSHLDAHKAMGGAVCPKCNHTWVAGYSDEVYKALLEEIAAKEGEIRSLTEVLKAKEEELEQNRGYIDLYRDYVNCTSNWPVLRPFWDYIATGDYVTQAPRKVLTLLETMRMDLEWEVQASKVESEIQETKDLIQSAEALGDANLNETQHKLTECTLSIESDSARLTNQKSCLSHYVQYRKQLQEAFDLSARINALLTRQETLNKDLIETIRRETINHCVRQLQSTLAVKQESLSAALLQKGIIEDIENNISQLTIEEEAAKLLVYELSPTEGLIAEGLLGFIRKYTQQMNNLLRKIWAYPLQIMDCGVSSAEGAELDYKFPLMVQDKRNVVPDVKFGSKGMHEVINLAFKVIAMRYLGLAEAPLYLDEFSSAMDAAHRINAMAAIKTLLETQPITQLFMISHYFETHGSFSNAQVCVLDSRNITVPVVNNQHVIIE